MSRFLEIFSSEQRVATDNSLAISLPFGSGSKRKNEFSHTAMYLSWYWNPSMVSVSSLTLKNPTPQSVMW